MRSKDYIPDFKSIFNNELTDFIKFKRSCGYVYGRANTSMSKLMDNFFISQKMSYKMVNQDMYDSWMNTMVTFTDSTRARYHSAMSSFCEYLRMLGYEEVIQPESLRLKYKSDFIPYVFNTIELERMFNQMAKNIQLNKGDIKSKDFYVLFCLYYGCGLRLSEGLNLRKENYDYESNTLHIIESKNNVTRLIPLSISISTQLEVLLSLKGIDEHIFFSAVKRSTAKQMVYDYYHNLLKVSKIPIRYDGKRQRIHDLRHTFAINALKQMEDKGFDLYTSLPILSVYLGHKTITETEYYLRLVEKEENNVTKKVYDYMINLYKQKEEFYEEE